jgi:electron transfer flavoprotein alpha subunit
MDNIGILIEINGGEIKKVNYGMITAARSSDNELYALILDGRGDAYKNKLQAYGVQKIINIVQEQGRLEWNPEVFSKAIIHTMSHFGINTLIGLTSAQGRDLLPRIAAGLDAPLVMDCIGFNLVDHVVTK